MLPSTQTTRGKQRSRATSARRRCRLVDQASRGLVASRLLGRRPHLRGLTLLGRAQVSLTAAIQRHAQEVMVMHLVLQPQAAQQAEILVASSVASLATFLVIASAKPMPLCAPMCPSPM